MKRRDKFAERLDSDARIETGIAVAQSVLNGRAKLLDSHLSEVLRIAVCKVTEARTHKHRTRYRSLDAYLKPDQPAEHEHVHTVLSLRNRLKAAQPDDVERILREAEAFTVTSMEHKTLGGIPSYITGVGQVKKSLGKL